MKQKILDVGYTLLDFLNKYQPATRGALGILLVIFVVGKIIGWITWSWWIVLSPFWAPFALAAFFWCISEIVGNFEKDA